jgi:lipid-A-disaccharide synthase
MAEYVRYFKRCGIESIGVGGPLSIAAGLVHTYHVDHLSGGGLVEAIGSIPGHVRVYSWLKRQLAKVDGLLMVDSPEIGLRLIPHAKKARVPVAYLSPPQAWAWRSWRAKVLVDVDWVGCLFSFETEWYRSRGVTAVTVGHPLAARPLLQPGDPFTVALLPGSRKNYIRRLLPIMLQAAELLTARFPSMRFHLGWARSAPLELAYRSIEKCTAQVTLHRGAEGALESSGIALTGLGTATLQGVLKGRPTMALGRVHPASAMVAARLLTTTYFALPNLLVDEKLFPELIQSDCEPTQIVRQLACLMDDFEDAYQRCIVVRRAVRPMDRSAPENALRAMGIPV